MPIIRSGVQYSGKWTKSQQMQAVAAGTWTGISFPELYAWGFNGTGQLGLGDITNRSSPVQVGALNNWKLVAMGGSSTLALNMDGKIYAWGNNSAGQLGLGDTTNRSSPVQVGALTTWRIMPTSGTATQHTLAITKS